MDASSARISAAFQKLPGAVAARARVPIAREHRAAVLVPFIDDDERPPRLLLTRRAADLPTHQGQVAFPGGFLLHPGEDAVEAALREAAEEIALPASAVEVLGVLDDFLTHTGIVAVTPVVGRIGSLPTLVAAQAEVARIFTIPVSELLRAERWNRRDPTIEFHHDGEILWGLSARIVMHLLDLTGLGVPEF